MMLRLLFVSSALLATASAQSAAKKEFEVASIRANPPQTGFRFGADAGGTPNLSNPGMFRCANCTLATLISTAFDLKNYQLPSRSALGNTTFEIAAKIPDGAAADDYRPMLQNMLKERFGLTFHYQEKSMRGYHLVIGKNGSKLKESAGEAKPAAPSRGWQEQGHSHTGTTNFGGQSSFNAANQTMADLAQMISDQLGVPVEDQTKLSARYDIALRWTGTAAPSGGGHGEGGFGGAGGHGDHGGGGAPVARREETGATIFEALQAQLGLRLVQAEQATARLFIVDHAERTPSAN